MHHLLRGATNEICTELVKFEIEEIEHNASETILIPKHHLYILFHASWVESQRAPRLQLDVLSNPQTNTPAVRCNNVLWISAAKDGLKGQDGDADMKD